MVTIFYGVIEEILNIINQILLMCILKKSKVKINWKKSIIIFFILILSFLVGKIFESQILTVIINIGIQFIFFMKIIEGTKKVKYIYFFYTLILQAFLMAILNLTFNIRSHYDSSTMSIAMLLFIIITIIFTYKKNKYYEDEEEINHYIYIFLTIGFLSGLLMISVVYLFGNRFSIALNIALLIATFIILIANIILYIFYSKKYKENLNHKTELVSLEHVLSMQEKYFHDTVESYKELRTFRHDVSGYFNTIDQLIRNEKYEELQLLTNNLKKTVDDGVLVSCNNIYVSATLNQFIHTFNEQSIKFDFQYNVLDEIVVDNNDSCSLIYNLMSNAVEACIKCNGKREIDLMLCSKNNALLIKVCNTVQDSFDLSMIKLGHTSKRNKHTHGMGLKNIDTVVKKYNGNLDFKLEKEKLEVSVILLEGIKKQ